MTATGARKSYQVELGIGKSRIVNFKVKPKTVAVGEEVRITGNLQGLTPIIGWGPMKNNKVQLVIDGQVAQTTTTGDAGDFYFHWYPKDVGTYWLRAQFPGTVLVGPSQTPEVAVEVLTEEEKKRKQQQFWIVVGLATALGLGALGIVAYQIEQQRLMMMMLA
jgi:hypothetical protein